MFLSIRVEVIYPSAIRAEVSYSPFLTSSLLESTDSTSIGSSFIFMMLANAARSWLSARFTMLLAEGRRLMGDELCIVCPLIATASTNCKINHMETMCQIGNVVGFSQAKFWFKAKHNLFSVSQASQKDCHIKKGINSIFYLISSQNMKKWVITLFANFVIAFKLKSCLLD